MKLTNPVFYLYTTEEHNVLVRVVVDKLKKNVLLIIE